MDCIKIRQLEIFAYHGCNEDEKINGQKFYVDANLYTDVRTPGLSDDLEDTVNYAKACKFINKFMTENRFDLIEAVAEQTTRGLLKEFPKIKAIDFTINKPNAPIKLPFGNVAVSISRKWNKAYLSIGSNIGDKEGYLNQAIDSLYDDENCRVLAVSKFIETEPYGPVEQDNFLNGCVEIETLYEPKELLATVNRIEAEANRTREIHWGPRTLDIDIVLYNNEGAPIWACANVDARAAREVSELKELHNNTFENEVYRATGQTLALSAIPRLLWLAHHRSDIYRQASTITMISDWLAYMLSGELAVDPSNAGTTGLLDLTTRDWKPALLDMAGLRADILSPVKETGTLLGVVSSQAAELCGLKAGTPVVVGGGDVQLGCLGLGVVRPAQTAVLGGTFWQQVVNLAAPVTDPEMNVRVNPHVIPGMLQAESISFFTGLTMRWFRDAFCAEEKLIAERLGIDTYTLLEEMASRVPPGSWGVMPIFSDRMRFKTWYHAAPSFINLSIDPDKCNKATLFRALEENAAIVSACNLQQIADFSNIHPSSLVFAGGGSKGKLWSQILADVSGLPVNIPVVKEATALGCAIAAGVGAGIFSSMAETGERLVRWERTHTPDPEKHELYQDSRDKWQAVYQDQLGLVDHGLTTSLWKAPGL